MSRIEEPRPSSRGFFDPGGEGPILIRSLTPPSQAGIALALRIHHTRPETYRGPKKGML